MAIKEIIAQIIGVILIILTLLIPHASNKKNILAYILLANLLSCLMFFFIDAKAGLYGLIVTTIRSIVYWMYSTKSKCTPLFILVLFVFLQISATIIGWVSWFSALTLSLLFNTYGQWQTNENILRFCLLISAVMMGFYCFHTHAYTGALNKWLQALSVSFALFRFRERKIQVYE